MALLAETKESTRIASHDRFFLQGYNLSYTQGQLSGTHEILVRTGTQRNAGHLKAMVNKKVNNIPTSNFPLHCNEMGAAHAPNVQRSYALAMVWLR